jgi:hypothetical protein
MNLTVRDHAIRHGHPIPQVGGALEAIDEAVLARQRHMEGAIGQAMHRWADLAVVIHDDRSGAVREPDAIQLDRCEDRRRLELEHDRFRPFGQVVVERLIVMRATAGRGISTLPQALLPPGIAT